MPCYAHSFSLITLLFLSLVYALRIDDFDSSVQYSGVWSDGRSILDNASLNWDGTLHYSNISGSTVTLNFTGTSIAVYGSFHPPGRYSMQSQYSVDNQPPTVFLPDEEVPVSVHQTLFYTSHQFLYGQHTLIVTNLGEQLFLDFFDVQDATMSTSTSVTGAKTNTSFIPFATPSDHAGVVTLTTTGSEAGTSTRSSSISTPTTDSIPIYVSSISKGPSILSTFISSLPSTDSTSMPVSITPTLTPLPTPKAAKLTMEATVGIAVAGTSLLALVGFTIWLCSKCTRKADSEPNEIGVPKGGALVHADLGGPKMIDAATSMCSQTSTILPPPHETSTLDSSAIPPSISENTSSPQGNAQQAITTNLSTSLPSPSTDPSHTDDGFPGSATLYASTTVVDIAGITKSEALSEASRLPSSQFPPSEPLDNVQVPLISTSWPSDEHIIPSVGGRTPSESRHIQEDGGVRLAGGLPGEADAEEENLDGWDDLPPPYRYRRV